MVNLHYNLPREYRDFGCPFLIIPCVHEAQIEIKYLFKKCPKSWSRVLETTSSSAVPEIPPVL
jgi:hypothetical protein